MNTDNRQNEEAPTVTELPFARTHRMAIFGGSFDPIHNGHLQIACHILSHDLADEVLFVPALTPPHKLTRELAMPMHRLEMIKLAIEDQAEKELIAEEKTRDVPEAEPPFHYAISYSDIELRRAGRKSYTFDTLSILRRIYPDYTLLLAIGMDSLCGLHQWYRASEIVQKTAFIVYPRPDVKPPAFIDLSKSFGTRNAQKLLGSILPEDECTLFSISSTKIRNGIAHGQDMSQDLPPSVWNYIRENVLYSN